MTCNVIALRTGSSTVLPLACEAEVSCTLSAYVVVAEVVVERLGV